MREDNDNTQHTRITDAGEDARPLLRELQKRFDSSQTKWKLPLKDIRKARETVRGDHGFEGEGDDEYNVGQGVRTNIVYSTIAALVPLIYAKNPEVSVRPTKNVDPTTDTYRQAGLFADTLEIVVNKQLHGAGLKRTAKQVVRDVLIGKVGVVKVSYQTDFFRDPIIAARLEDLQGKLANLRTTAQNLEDSDITDEDRQIEIDLMKQEVEALQDQVEVVRAEGTVIDQIPIEDFRIDPALDSLYRYREAAWMGHTSWMTLHDIRKSFAPTEEALKNFHRYKRTSTGIPERMGEELAQEQRLQDEDVEHGGVVVPVSELWDRQTNSVYTWAEGSKDWLREPWIPERLGRRFYPFFLLGFNWLDCTQEFPISDVELYESLGVEYNETRQQSHAHRKLSRPHYVGDASLIGDREDIKTFAVAQLGDVALLNAGGRDVNDVFRPADVVPYNPAVYDVSAIRADLDLMSGVGDAQRGSVLRAKTAREAGYQQQGMAGRADSRRDDTEEWVADIARFDAEILVQSMSLEQVQRSAGQEAFWPILSREELYTMVEVEVRAGSSGNPNQQQERESWGAILPMILENVQFIMQMRGQGIPDSENPYIQVLIETLNRFDERIDVEKFLPGEPVMDQQGGMAGAIGPQGVTPEELAQQEMQAQQQPQQGAPPEEPMPQADPRMEQDYKMQREGEMHTGKMAQQQMQMQQAQELHEQKIRTMKQQ